MERIHKNLQEKCLRPRALLLATFLQLIGLASTSATEKGLVMDGVRRSVLFFLAYIEAQCYACISILYRYMYMFMYQAVFRCAVVIIYFIINIYRCFFILYIYTLDSHTSLLLHLHLNN